MLNFSSNMDICST